MLHVFSVRNGIKLEKWHHMLPILVKVTIFWDLRALLYLLSGKIFPVLLYFLL
jgi:hypothetical protein